MTRALVVVASLMGLWMAAGCAHGPAPKSETAAPKKKSPVEERLDAMTASLDKDDYEGALHDTDAWLQTGPDVETQALIYNCRTWIRWGGGDKSSAVAENEKLREAVADVGDAIKRGAMLHYWWDRAYLEAEAGRDAAAAQSRAQFDALGNRPDDADSRKVLEAWLAARRGDGHAAKAAAQAVNVERDGDVQDLYVVAVALEAGGDAAGAEKVRARIRKAPSFPMKPLILKQMVRDASRPPTPPPTPR